MKRITFFQFQEGGTTVMEGWTEEEMKDKNLMAPCGLYCGACGVYIATRDKNEKFKEVMGNLYGTKAEDTNAVAACNPSRQRSSMAIAPCARSGIVSVRKVITPAINAANGHAV